MDAAKKIKKSLEKLKAIELEKIEKSKKKLKADKYSSLLCSNNCFKSSFETFI